MRQWDKMRTQIKALVLILLCANLVSCAKNPGGDTERKYITSKDDPRLESFMQDDKLQYADDDGKSSDRKPLITFLHKKKNLSGKKPCSGKDCGSDLFGNDDNIGDDGLSKLIKHKDKSKHQQINSDGNSNSYSDNINQAYAFARPAKKSGPTFSKDDFKQATNTKSNPAVSALRTQALRETALSLGARGGLAERSSQLNYLLIQYESLLSKVFNFYGMTLDDNVLPPVLVEARNTLNLTGTDAIRVADRNYKIIQQAQFITAPPTWREYLWMNYEPPEMPDKTLLPRNKAEKIIWEHDIEEGWQAGSSQAEVIYHENLSRLVRDYKGMILYRKLLAQNMVSAPFVATVDMGITGGESDMSINDRVLRITSFPELNPEGQTWKTEMRAYE